MNGVVTLEELCRKLSISLATGKNWVKLQKIIPGKIVDSKIYFDEEYCKTLIKDLQNDENNILKSRRNKKLKNGYSLYKSYVSKGSKNILILEDLISFLDSKLKILTSDNIKELISYYSAKMLSAYFRTDFDKYKYLVSDISNTEKIFELYPHLKEYEFEYESGEDILGLIYLSLENINKRKSQGAYYTPTNVVKRLILKTFENYKSGKILDPCCGSGNFLIQLPDIISPEDIYGGDINDLSVKIARLNFAMKYKIFDKNFLYEHIIVQNFLTSESKSKYDYIIGNPPWAYQFTEKEKTILRKKYLTAQGSNIESYDVVTEQALNKLNLNGYLSFVLPEAVLNVKSHSSLRKIIAAKSSIKYIEYLGETFDGVQCPSVIMGICYNNNPLNTKGMIVNFRGREFVINLSRKISSGMFNFNCDDEEYALLEQMENIPNKVYLKNNAQFALGIVTGDNSKYLSNKKTPDNELILKGTDIEKFRIKPCGNYIKYKSDEFQQCASSEFYRVKEKLVYKFISKKLVFAYDDKQTLTLNSCNILIPQIEGLNIKYILGVLNSDIVQFYFDKKFNSVKVLRSHLEQIPIPFVDYAHQKPIIELVDKILSGIDGKDLLGELNEKIKYLY